MITARPLKSGSTTQRTPQLTNHEDLEAVDVQYTNGESLQVLLHSFVDALK